MAEAIFDLEQVLRSRREKLTIQEANVLMSWRAKALRDFTIGYGAGSIVTWLATRRFRTLIRANLALGAGAVCGLWRFGRSAESCLERVLSLEGSRIQQELAAIMLKKYSNDPWILQRLSKHFYSEEVYVDSSIDKPVFRWRFRNFGGDPMDQSQRTSESEETVPMKNDVKKTTSVEPKQIYANAARGAVEDAARGTIEDPFDIMFGLPGSSENIPYVDASNTSSRRQSRRDKRSRRRHRKHHEEDSE